MPRAVVSTTGMNYTQHPGVKENVIWLALENKNKPGSEALAAKMTVFGYLLGRLVCSQPGEPPAVGEAGEAPGWQALVATASVGHFPLGLRESACPPLVQMSQGAQETHKNNNDSLPLTALPERGEGGKCFFIVLNRYE